MPDPAPSPDPEADPAAAALEAASNHQFQSGAYAHALALRRQALALHVERHRLADQARCQQSIGYLSFLLRDHAGAERAYRAAIRIKEDLMDWRGAAVGWGRLAELLQHAGDHRAALQAFDQALAFLRRCGALKDVGTVLNNKAVSHRELGERALAIQCHERALEIRRRVGDDAGLAASLHNLGVLHADVGAYDAAKEALETAHRLREGLGDQSGLASTALRLGVLHEEQGDFARAMASYEGVIAACEARPDGTDNLAAALCNLGGLLIGQGDAGRATPLLERARSLLQGGVETPGLGQVEFHLGLARIAQGQVDEGLVALAAAQRIQQACGDIRHLSATLSARALVDVRFARFAQAQALLRQALDMQERLEEHGARVHTLRLLGHCLAGQGDSEAAQRCHTQAEQLSMLLSFSGRGADAAGGPRQDATATLPVGGARGWLQ